LFELVVDRFVIAFCVLLRLLMLLRLDWFNVDEFDRVVICRPSVLEFGALVRELIDRLDMLLLGARLVMALLEMLELGVRLVMALLEVLLLGVRLVMALLEVLLLGVRLAVIRLELRLDETLLELLEDDDLEFALGAGAGLEACRLCLLELLDLLLLDRFVAAKTGSQNNKRANNMQKTRKSEPFCVLYSVFCILINIIRLLSSALTSLLLFYLLKAQVRPLVTKNPPKTSFFHFFCIFLKKL